jgi:hypothetical protein
LDDTVYLIQPKVALVAMNMTIRAGEELHYRLFVSIVPPNIDVWGWVKYFRDPPGIDFTKLRFGRKHFGYIFHPMYNSGQFYIRKLRL